VQAVGQEEVGGVDDGSLDGGGRGAGGDDVCLGGAVRLVGVDGLMM